MQKYGIDISKHQGTIDWKTIAEQYRVGKINFVIIRAGYGNSASQIDTQFNANYAGAKVHKIPVGAYWYSYAKDAKDATQEAQACLQIINGKEFTYPVWYDIEYEEDILNQTNAGRTECCKAFCETIKKAGYKPGIYCSRNFVASKLNYNEILQYDLWVAAYTGTNGPGNVPIPYTMWQYSSANPLNIPGFGMHLDCNICYKDYESEDKEMDYSADTYKIGPVSGGDRRTMTNLADGLGLNHIDNGDYIIIGPASLGDRKQIVNKALELQLSVEPYVEKNDSVPDTPVLDEPATDIIPKGAIVMETNDEKAKHLLLSLADILNVKTTIY